MDDLVLACALLPTPVCPPKSVSTGMFRISGFGNITKHLLLFSIFRRTSNHAVSASRFANAEPDLNDKAGLRSKFAKPN